MSSLTIAVTHVDNTVEVVMQGQINEDSNFDSLKGLNPQRMILNLKGISHINSCGIREWIEFQKEHFKAEEVIYQECPQVIVEQMNIVSGFVHSNGIIESFYAPYYSEALDKELKLLLKPADIIGGKAPAKTDEQGGELEFDDIEAQYFNFLRK
jgi:anti-anti-sigma regulatory factor